jgi:hypothetical protein
MANVCECYSRGVDTGRHEDVEDTLVGGVKGTRAVLCTTLNRYCDRRGRWSFPGGGYGCSACVKRI